MKRVLCALLCLGACVFLSAGELDDFADFENEYQNIPVVNDPYYKFNSKVHQFNTAMFNMSIRPLGATYKAFTFPIVRKGVGNFFANLKAPLKAISLLASGRGKDAAQTFGGFLINSMAGFGGIIKIAPHGPESDFGLAAARWGMQPGAHIELPFFGPSNLRDALFMPLNWLFLPSAWIDRNAALGLRALSLADSAARYEVLINQGLNSINSYTISRDFYEKLRKEQE